MFRKSSLILILVAFILGLSGCQRQVHLQRPLSHGYVKPVTIDYIIAKYNKAIKKEAKLIPLQQEMIIVEKETYWYRIKNGLIYEVRPLQFTNNLKKDILKSITIYVQQDTNNDQIAQLGFEYLLRVNNPELSDDDLKTLFNKVHQKDNFGTPVSIGKGILVEYNENQGYHKYCLIRNYKVKDSKAK